MKTQDKCGQHPSHQPLPLWKGLAGPPSCQHPHPKANMEAQSEASLCTMPSPDPPLRGQAQGSDPTPC